MYRKLDTKQIIWISIYINLRKDTSKQMFATLNIDGILCGERAGTVKIALEAA
jgi:hypothetical protein